MLETYLPFLARRRRITYEMLRSIQAVAEQVVMATEQTFRLTGEHKKEIALKVLSQILEEMGIEAPDPLLDIAIEAAVRAMKMLERASEPAA